MAFFWSVFAAYAGGAAEPETVQKWCILLNYDSSNPSINCSDLADYDMAILDPDTHPRLDDVKNDVLLIAYVSVGEAETYRGYWDRIKGEPWVIGENPDWEGNYYVDVREQEWRDILLDEVIPGVLAQGFRGIMMDTLDTSSMLEDTMPDKYAGSNRAMADLVEAIHERYPGLFLISNNGFSILKEIAPYLSGALCEDIYMMPDFEKGGYKPVPEDDRKYKLSILNGIARENNTPVFVIDYVSQTDTALIRKTRKKIKKLGFKPYIAEKDLNALYEN